jgi:Mor family transcriptional regulator
MPPTPAPDGRARSADERIAELNAAIRALFPHRDARLTDEQRAQYRALLAELERVKRGDITMAA